MDETNVGHIDLSAGAGTTTAGTTARGHAGEATAKCGSPSGTSEPTSGGSTAGRSEPRLSFAILY